MRRSSRRQVVSTMKRHLTALGFLAGMCLPGLADADEKAPPPAPGAGDSAPARGARAKHPVRMGPTTVTVIDEQEAVDDVISRVREERARTPQAFRNERRETRQQRLQDLKQARRQRAAQLRDGTPARPAHVNSVQGPTTPPGHPRVRDRLRDLQRERDRNATRQPGTRPLRTRAPGR